VLYNTSFNKSNLDYYLKELAYEFRKLNRGGYPIEMIIVGGAAILANYGFRDSTTDIDCYAPIESSLKMAIQRVGERFGLDPHWVNSDFKNTASYSPKVVEFSRHYRDFNHTFSVRVITGAYLIAMKLVAARTYKYDQSDILGILIEHQRQLEPINLEMIQKAVLDLYEKLDVVKPEMWKFIEDLLKIEDLEETYLFSRTLEISNAEIQEFIHLDQTDNTKELLQMLEI